MAGFARGRGPRVSSTPPPARRVPVVGGERPPAPARVLGESYEPGRVYALFGACGVGVSTLCAIADEETQTKTARIRGGGEFIEVERAIWAARRRGAEVIWLEHCPVGVDDVQWLYDERLVAPGWGGAIIRVVRNAVAVPVTGLAAIEERIIALSLPYFVVRNDDLERGVVELLSRAGVTR